jgi:hypothetical protein
LTSRADGGSIVEVSTLIGVRRSLLLPLLIVLAALASCATPPRMEDPGVRVIPARLAAFPSLGQSFMLDVAKDATVDTDQSIDTRKNVDDAINFRVAAHGGRSFLARTVAQLEHATEFSHWSRRMLNQVILERVDKDVPRHRSVADWAFPGSLASWRTTLSADFVLVSQFYEGTETVGRAALSTFAGGDRAARRAIACVVQLEDGRVVWCKFVGRFYSDLRTRAGAQELVDKLLDKMLAGAG